MRVWLLTSELPHEIAGGIARYIDNFSRLLGEAGCEVVILARTEQPCDRILAPGVRLIGVVPRYGQRHELGPSDRPEAHPAYPYNILSYWPALSYQFAEETLKLLDAVPPPDIIESQEYAALPYFLLQRKLTEQSPLERIPILVQMHSPTFELAPVNQEPRYRFPQYWVGQMEKFCILAADALLAPSAFLAHRIERAFPQRGSIPHLPLPLVLPPQLVENQPEPAHIVYVGRLEPRKGVFPLVKACVRLWQTGMDFRLTLVGGDVEFFPKQTMVGAFIRQRYQQWIEKGRLTLAGQCDQAGVFAQLRRAWAVVIPSLWENFPNTCMEAMGAGQVVLASEHGGQAEMIGHDGVNGFLFDWNRPGDFERQLRAILALREEEREQVGRRARERILALCSPEAVLPQRLQHYERVIAEASPPRLFPSVNGPSSRVENTTTPSANLGQQDLLSIVIPYYNLGAYLEETVNSVLSSTYAPYEVVIINDGSTDQRSLDSLHAIEQRGLPQVRIFHTENQGLAAARNAGAEAARGEFLAFVDADDVVEAEFFARGIAVLQRYANVAFVYSWVRYFDEAAAIWPTWNVELPYFLGHNMLTPLAIVRRAAFLQHARNRVEFEYNFEDYESWVALVEAGGVGVSLPHPLVRYRVRSGSMYQSSNRDQQLYLYDLLVERHPELYGQWGRELFHLQNANGPGRLWSHPAAESGEPTPTYTAVLEEERGKLAETVHTLGKAWEDHVRFIESQRLYIHDLETRCSELLTLMNANGAASAVGRNNGVSWRDYELGGRLVSRLRNSWVVRRALRSSLLKKAVRKTLRL